MARRAINGSLSMVAVATGLVLCPPSHAQTVAAPDGPPPDVASRETTASTPNDGVDDIVVTARRREENIQTVPVAVSVIGAQALVAQGIQTTNDVQRFVPGVILNGAGSMSNTTYTIRGQGKAVTGPGLPSVITYMNEVPLPSIGSFAPTFDVNNVQVLKGPQGTLFGRNTTGGAVLVYSTPATMDFGGYAQADIGNYNKRAFQGALNLPIINDVLAVRVAADIERRKGFTRNLFTGKNTDDAHMDAFRVSVRFQPTDSIRNDLVFDHTRIETNAQGFYPFQVLRPELLAPAAALRAAGRRTVRTAIDPFDNETFWGISNTTTIDVGSVTFKNIFGYRYTNVDNFQDATGLGTAPLPDLGPGLLALGYVPGQPGTLITTRNHSVSEQFSNEVQLSGKAFHEALSWLVGGFYVDVGPAGVNYLVLDLFRPTPPSPTTQFIVNNFLGGIWPVSQLADTLYADRSKALFANLAYKFDTLVPALAGLTLNAGFRYTWDKPSVCSNGRASIALATGQTVAAPYTEKECRADQGSIYGPKSFFGSAKSKAPTYTLGLDYALNRDVFLYLTTRRGYRAGGLNTPLLGASLAPFQSFGPQKVTDYEIGAKLQWRRGGWNGRFNIAAFTAKFTGVQLLATGITAASGLPGIDSTNAPSNSTLQINAGSVRSKGVEVGGSLSPTRGLNLSFGGSYLNQKFIEQVAPPILAPFFQAREGFTGTPKWSYQLAADYELPISSGVGTFALHADHYYIAKYFQGPVLLPSYRLTSFNVRWTEVQGLPLSLTLYVDNAFDKQYVQNVILSTPSFGVYSGSFAPPRTYGVRLRYNFGSK